MDIIRHRRLFRTPAAAGLFLGLVIGLLAFFAALYVPQLVGWLVFDVGGW